MNEVEICVTSELEEVQECDLCKENKNTLRVDIENKIHVFSMHLCNYCARELGAQLDVMSK